MNNVEVKKGRKRKRNEEEWKFNRMKKARNSGMSYVSHSGVRVEQKTFKAVAKCCKNECFKICNAKDQEKKFHDFWNLGKYSAQNVLLSSCLKLREPDYGESAKNLKRLVVWLYLLPTDETIHLVCEQFLINLFQIGRKRIRTIQDKIKNHESLEDRRGSNNNHNLKLTDEIKELILLHCHSLPHRQSHYSNEVSSLKYFENSTLNLSIMYTLFLEYYEAVTGTNEPPIGEQTYADFFNKYSGFTFQMPRTDVCNTCYHNSITGIENEEIRTHKLKAKNYFKIKKELLSETDTLRLEFDFAQNLPLPKLPVSEQFFKRLLWIYVFNVHVHGTTSSYMFLMPEGYSKKGANTVCNFVYHVIKAEFDPTHHKKIILFSDTCGGQNRNYTMMRFLSSLSMKLRVQIDYLYPVRGHSFNQCDRNFGMYTQKKKKMERIETKEQYATLIRSARDPSFTVLQENEYDLVDYERVFKGAVRGLKITQMFYFHYYPDGNVDVLEDYYGRRQKFEILPKIQFDEIDIVAPPSAGISDAKVKDVSSLLRYLDPSNATDYLQHFNKVGIKREKVEIKEEIEEKKIVKTEKKNKESKKKEPGKVQQRGKSLLRKTEKNGKSK